ncbi:MAG TPA: serine/threonine-protein kinase, partial [Rhodanobacteraceae bacterium]|nr:serine/threonine-protein kinase [Rhodanobacteraceae bacterium]
MSRWERVKTLFAEGRDVPAAARGAWLAQACQDDPALRDEVEALLRAHDDPTSLLSGDGSDLLDKLIAEDEPADALIGTRIGPYRLLRLVGEGGMGQVFLAERRDGDFSQRVALKRIRGDFGGAEAHVRFLREREILARLVHPHIAQLHDGGLAADGLPYFTLEYVDGVPITRYCDARALDLRTRLALMLQVCAAVAYAHRSLVVHRDLKPSNILVDDEGQVKLLDFGIAKLIEDAPGTTLTGTHAGVMTREYAAPEQVLGEPITTATDVYALGVLTYEILTGRMPYPDAEAGRVGYAKAIVEQPPTLPSHVLRKPLDGDSPRARPAETIAAQRATTAPQLQRTLRGDLDRVLLRALEKSPDARYPTVGAFADDLRAYLDGRPLRGGTRAYRVRKFARRHWLPLAATATAALAVLLGSTIVAFEARERANAAERALREAETTAAVKDFLLGLFAGADPRQNAGKTPGVRDLLDKGALHIDHDLGAQPALQAELKGVLGGIYSRLGLYPQAMKLQEDAIAGLDRAGGQETLAAITVLDYATTVRASGDPERARPILSESIARFDALPSPPLGRLVYALYLRAFVAIGEHRFDDALVDAGRAESIARAHPDKPSMLGDALHAKASAQWGLHDYKDAEVELKEAIEKHVAAGPTSRMAAGADRQTLALIYSETGRYDEALPLTEAVLANAREVMGEKHPYVAQAMVATANDLFNLGRYAEAEQRLRAALAMQRELLAPDSYYFADTLRALGIVLFEERKLDEAESSLVQAKDLLTKRYGADYSNVLDVQSALAMVALARGRADAAEGALRRLVADRERTHDTNVAMDKARLAEAERRNGRVDAAIADAGAALANATEIHGAKSWEAATAQRSLGLALADAGRTDEAATALRAAIAYYDGLAPGGDHPLAATTRLALGEVLARGPSTHAEGLAEAGR